MASLAHPFHVKAQTRHDMASAVTGAVLRAVSWPFKVIEARRELSRLAQFSEYELRDIGLTRQDIRNASALTADSDPTAFLANVAADRRNAEKASRRCVLR